MRNEFEIAFNEITEMRALPREIVLEALQTALISAYRRDANASAAQRVDATIDPNTGRARIYVEKEVVDEVMNFNTEVDLEKARYYRPEANLGDMVMVGVEGTTKKFGRIAAQTAKQVILQKIREAERNALYEEFSGKEGDLMVGTVQSINANMVTLSLGRTEAVLPRAQQIPGEKYKPHDKIRTYVLEVKRTNRGPSIVVSRAHRNMLRRLLEYEVPEIYNGQVEIKNIAREAGHRSKVAVAALQEGIDPVGACVGIRGIRIQNIVKELHDEKIDVIEWNPDQEEFIKKALSPARVTGVYLEDDPDAGRTATVIVPDDQLSLAIGREGQNARLAAKLTGWRIDIKSVTEAVGDTLAKIETPAFADIKKRTTEMLPDVRRVLEKKSANRVISPEEYTALGKFADLVERRLLAARENARKARIEELNAVRATLPRRAFETPVTALDLPDAFIEALQPLDNVGEIMLRFLIDEDRLRHMLSGQSRDALARVQTALDKLMLEDEQPTEEPVKPAAAAAVSPEPAQPVASNEGETVAPAAFGDEHLVVAAPKKAEPVAEAPKKVVPVQQEEAEFGEYDFEDADDDFSPLSKEGKKKKQKERQQRREIVFDEDRGVQFVKRKRKGSRQRDSWDVEE
ncbi:MAG: transcription termination factor NusA [Anaerolineae bacterium]